MGYSSPKQMNTACLIHLLCADKQVLAPNIKNKRASLLIYRTFAQMKSMIFLLLLFSMVDRTALSLHIRLAEHKLMTQEKLLKKYT